MQLADNRPLVLLGLGLPVLGAISPYLAPPRSRLTPPRPTAGWVAFNIAQPALRQLDSMTGAEAPKKGPTKRRSAAAALTGLTAGALLAAPEQADAAQVRGGADGQSCTTPEADAQPPSPFWAAGAAAVG